MPNSQDDSQADRLYTQLERIATALEAQSGRGTPKTPRDWDETKTWLWRAQELSLKPIYETSALPIELLIGLDNQLETLMENTLAFAKGYSANNALLWGARGTGKSSLVKAVHAKAIHEKVATGSKNPIHLIEIYREDIGTLPLLLDLLRAEPDQRFILFCDDLSFDEHDSSYKSLKAILDGGIEGRPENVILYATSNRRHLLPRNMVDNQRSTAVHKSEGLEETVSLSDRFGLWLGFYNVDQPTYLKMIDGYAAHFDLKIDEKDALEWAMTRGNRSGRVAWQYIQHVAGQQGKTL
jgi:hypothetical protein